MDDERVPEEGVVPSPSRRPLSYDALNLGERIGRGGNADVRVATVPTDDGPLRVAVKEPRFDGTLERGAAAGFEREVEAWAELADHESIVGVVDWGSQPIPWLALEYVDGGSLADHLVGGEGGLQLDHAAWIGTRIASAVRYAHRHGVAHLDLKPANVLLREVEGSWDVPKVTDWGLARFLLDHSGSVEGLSPRYAAPEQFDAETYGDPDDFTDIYGIGAVVYELLTGRPPFDGSGVAVMQSVLNDEPAPPTDIDPSLPSVADEVLGRALATEKRDRHETAVHLREDLERLYEAARGAGSGAGGSGVDTGPAETAGTETGGSGDSVESDRPHSRSETEGGSAGPDILAEHPARSAVERHADLDDAVWAPVLEGLGTDPSNTSPFRVTVDEASTGEGNAVLHGRVAAGDSAATAPAGLEGESVTVQPSGAAGTVSSLLRNGTVGDFASAGDEVAIEVEGIDADDVRRGDICGPAADPPVAVESFTARLHVFDHPSVITAGYTPVVHAHTAQVACTFETLHSKWPADGGTATTDPDFAQSGDVIEVTLEPQKPLAMEPFDAVPELSGFTMRDMGQSIAVGVVTDVEPVDATDTDDSAGATDTDDSGTTTPRRRLDAPTIEDDGIELDDAWDDLLATLDTTVDLDAALPTADEAPLRLPLEDVYTLSDVGVVTTGRVETGRLSSDHEVAFQPAGVTGRVAGVERDHETVDEATVGDVVGVGLEGVSDDEIRRGDVCGPIDDPPAVAASFTARLYVLDHPSVITAGYTPVVHAHTTQVACTFETLHERRAAPRGTATFDPDYIESGDFAEVTLTPQRPLAVAPVTETPELSTFTVRDMGQAIAVGIVTEVTPE